MTNFKHTTDKDKWILAEDMPNMDLFFSQIFLKMYVDTLENNTGVFYKKTLAKYEGYNLWFYYGDNDSIEVGDKVVEKIVNDSGFAEKVNKKIIEHADKLKEFSLTIPQENLDKLSDEELWKIYDKHYQVHSEYYTWGGHTSGR